MFKPVIFTMLISLVAMGAGTRVGNGDDGRDLEQLEEVSSGKLIESRKKAVEILKTFQVNKIPHLGLLIPEVKNSRIFLAKSDVAAKNSDLERSPSGLVYARTFAEPHAATRFFPIALKLEEPELIALHIHEGLHRSLPDHVKEDEQVVSDITLSIVSPGATFDRIRRTVVSRVDLEVPTRIMASQTVSKQTKSPLSKEIDFQVLALEESIVQQLQGRFSVFENRNLNFSLLLGAQTRFGELGVGQEILGSWSAGLGASYKLDETMILRSEFRNSTPLAQSTSVFSPSFQAKDDIELGIDFTRPTFSWGVSFRREVFKSKLNYDYRPFETLQFELWYRKNWNRSSITGKSRLNSAKYEKQDRFTSDGSAALSQYFEYAHNFGQYTVSVHSEIYLSGGQLGTNYLNSNMTPSNLGIGVKYVF